MMATKKAAAKKTSVKKSTSKKAFAKKSADHQYPPEASEDVEREMKAMKRAS